MSKPAHITVRGKPLCKSHNHILGTVKAGVTITCDYTSKAAANRAAAALKLRFVETTAEKVSVEDGPCPLARPRLYKSMEQRFRDTAKKLHYDEGVLEIDDNAKVSRSDDSEGAYVEAWVWVSAEEVRSHS